MAVAPFCSGFGYKPTKERKMCIMKFKKAALLTVLATVCLIVSATTVFATTAQHSGDGSDAQTKQAEASTPDAAPDKEPSDSTPRTPSDEKPTDDETQPEDTAPVDDVDEASISPFERYAGQLLDTPPENSGFACFMDRDEDGNLIFAYLPLDDEPTDTPVEPTNYTHEEIVDGGVIRW